MDCLDTFISSKFDAFLLPPPSFQISTLSLRRLQNQRGAIAATQNAMAPAFGQTMHLQLQDSQRWEGPSVAEASAAAFTQNPVLNYGEKHREADPFIEEAPFPSSSSFLAGEHQDCVESPSLDLATYFRNPERITTAHEALQTLLSGQNSTQLSKREEWLIKTLKERRETVKELLMASLKAVRLRPTFSKAVVDSMPEFVDLVMIKAAALKKTREHVNAPFSYRARLYIEQAGVGKKVRWLRQHKFTYSKIGKFVFMVEDHEGNLQPKIKWLKSINVHGSDLGAALTRDPPILEKTMHELKQNVELLKTAGVRVDWIGWVIRRSSRVLACSKEELQERIDFYGCLGVKGDNFGKMVYHFPACLGHFPLDEMYSKLDYLKGFGLDDWALGEVLASKPQLIARSIEEDWKPLVKLFYFLGIDGYGLRKILTVQPSVFCLNIKNTIAPKIRFLRDVGVREEAIGDVIVKSPSFLSYSLDEKIRPCVIFLLEKAAVPINNVGKVLSLQPDLIACSITKKLEIVVRFFIFHGFQREQVGTMVTDFPRLLRYSLTSLKPKLSYALRVMKLPVEEVVKFPRLFSHSLESRIIPRYKTLKKKGLNYNLRRMLACSDEEFIKGLHEEGTDEADGMLERDRGLETSWLDATDGMDSDGMSDESAEMETVDMLESSWHRAFKAEADEVFDGGECILNESWHGALNAEDIEDVFDEELTSDTSWHSPDAIHEEDMDEQFDTEVSSEISWAIS